MSTDNAQLEKEIFMIISHQRYGGSIYMIPKGDFEKYFEVINHRSAKATKKKHDCALKNCQCQRWDSYLCNHEISYTKSLYSYGDSYGYPYKLCGIYSLYDSNPFLDGEY